MAWLDEVAADMRLPSTVGELLYMRGDELCALELDAVVRRAPYLGEHVHAKLLIWKTGQIYKDFDHPK